MISGGKKTSFFNRSLHDSPVMLDFIKEEAIDVAGRKSEGKALISE